VITATKVKIQSPVIKTSEVLTIKLT